MTNVQRWMLRRRLPHGITMVNRSGWGSWVDWSGLATLLSEMTGALAALAPALDVRL
jgi:hypothetical protein